LRLAVPNGPRDRLTVFGDMSASLCRNGDFEAALELERLWDDLTRALPFFTICGYPTDGFEHSDALHLLSNVCAAHSAVTFGHFAAAAARHQLRWPHEPRHFIAPGKRRAVPAGGG